MTTAPYKIRCALHAGPLSPLHNVAEAIEGAYEIKGLHVGRMVLQNIN